MVKKSGRIENRIKKYVFAAILLGAIGGLTIGYSFGSPQKGEGYWLWSNTFNLYVYGKIHIEVTPQEYPVLGQSWTIFVYSTNRTSEGISLTQLPNVTVAVSVNDNGNSKIYNLLTDEKGRTEFQYLPSYSDVSFQASELNNQSEKIVISRHYVSSNVVETMLTVNSLFALATGVGTGLAKLKLRIRKALSALFIPVIVLFAVISLLSFYSRFFLETPWGYPEALIGGIISLDILKYATIIGVALLLSFSILTTLISIKHA